MRLHQVKAAGGQPHGRPDRIRRKPILSNPRNSYERYMALARDAALGGDAIATENFYQHADHYFRQMREKQA